MSYLILLKVESYLVCILFCVVVYLTIMVLETINHKSVI